MSNNEGVSMERLSIDEAIKHAKETAERKRESAIGIWRKKLNNPNFPWGRDFTREEVERKEKECIQCAEEHEQLAKWLEKLKEYEDAEEKGLLPKFYLGYEFWIEWLGEILKAKIVMLQQKKDGTWKYRFCDERSHTMDYEENELGKYFFATKEEAEQALKQMGE